MFHSEILFASYDIRDWYSIFVRVLIVRLRHHFFSSFLSEDHPHISNIDLLDSYFTWLHTLITLHAAFASSYRFTSLVSSLRLSTPGTHNQSMIRRHRGRAMAQNCGALHDDSLLWDTRGILLALYTHIITTWFEALIESSQARRGNLQELYSESDHSRWTTQEELTALLSINCPQWSRPNLHPLNLT